VGVWSAAGTLEVNMEQAHLHVTIVDGSESGVTGLFMTTTKMIYLYHSKKDRGVMKIK
jgi:hypothetical protein